MRSIDKEKPVMISGASGYIASWIVKKLLEKGFTVHGTVRSIGADKNAHLDSLSAEYPSKLKLFEADLLVPGSFEKAMKDCELVIHTASPFLIGKTSNADKQFIKPALEGTRNVLNTANKIHSVKRIVLTSSTAATYGDAIDAKDLPNRTLNETHWNTSSNSSHQAYSYSKTIAEKEAWKIAKAQQRWDLVVINPGFVLGPSLSKRIDSASIDFMRQLVKGQMKAGVPDMYLPTVDVRDVALAHILAGTIASASGRHLVVAETMNVAELAKRLKKTQKDSIAVSSKVIPKAIMYIAGPIMGFSFKYVKRNIGIPLNFDNSYSISDLGMVYRPIETTLAEHVEQLRRDQLV